MFARSPYSLNCHGDAKLTFHKLCSIYSTVFKRAQNWVTASVSDRSQTIHNN